MERNESFELFPAQYDRARPEYPDWIGETIKNYADVGPGKKLLEIGCGTGKATRLFVDSGASMECLDIGEKLIGIAKNKFSTFSNVKFIKTHFEDFKTEPESYDLIYSAAAFHWIRQPEGNSKVARLLKKEGRFAIIGHTPAVQKDSFFIESQPIYESAGMKRDERGHNPDQKPKNMDIAFFKILYKDFRPWEKSYTTGEYFDLIFTYSDHILMPDELKEQFKTRIRELIDTRYGGKITKKYETKIEIGTRL